MRRDKAKKSAPPKKSFVFVWGVQSLGRSSASVLVLFCGGCCCCCWDTWASGGVSVVEVGCNGGVDAASEGSDFGFERNLENMSTILLGFCLGVSF